MPEFAYDLLRDPLLGVRSAAGQQENVTLPGALSRLGADETGAFTALQPHQSHSWHAFLVQLAALALDRAGATDPALPENGWREHLLALTGGRFEPWCLLVDDLSRPAFMQPPVPEGTLKGFKGAIPYPDALDILVTSKDHDVKSARIAEPRPEHWVYALVSLQTMQGFSGRDNYGVVRMNGGFGNRPGVAFAPGLSWGPRFIRDVSILLAERARIIENHGYSDREGEALLWLQPWDGTKSVPIEKCDPFFVEICRRVRLTDEHGSVAARTAPSKVKRIASSVDNGDTGDIWTPLKSGGAALTLDGSGFTYRRLSQILFTTDFDLPPAAAIQPGDADDMVLVARAMVRGQGKTEGLHQRMVPLPRPIRRRLGNPLERPTLAELAKRRVEQAARVDRSILHPSLCVLLQAGPEKADFRDGRTQPWRDRFNAAVDQMFFTQLWHDAEATPVEAELRWAEVLQQLGRAQLNEAIDSAPVPVARRYRAIAAAERVFGGAFRKHFPQLYERSADELDTTA